MSESTPTGTGKQKLKAFLSPVRRKTTLGSSTNSGNSSNAPSIPLPLGMDDRGLSCDTRKDYLRKLINERRARIQYFNKIMGRKDRDSRLSRKSPGGKVDKPDLRRSVSGDSTASARTSDYSFELTEEQKKSLQKTSDALRHVQEVMNEYGAFTEAAFPIEVRMDRLTYCVPVIRGGPKIKTVYNSGLIFKAIQFFKRLREATVDEEVDSKAILDDISVVLRPGKMYLVLGPPGAGKSTFLKAVAGRLKIRKNQELDGHVYYNGKRLEDKTKFHIENAISFIDQLDRHAPRLTVDETFEFAYQCKKGGTHINFKFVENTKEAREAQRKADAERVLVNTNLESLGLEHVRDTFVGDDDVRGVSGGQRRRVTVGEMLMDSSPILCADEISNGLDASSTYEMIQILMHIGRIQRRTRVISLLQPSPETVSLFDEVILLAEGHLLYAGPISQVEDYFLDLGYRAPDHMDIADFLQLLSTPDGETFFVPQENGPDARLEPYSVAELAELFRKSPFGKVISEGMEAPYQYVWSSARDVHHIEEAVDHLNDHRFQHRYENSFIRSVYLNLKRNLTIWKRDKRVLIANAVKNAIMGISVGGVFFQTEDVISILGVLFQGMLFIMLGGMTNAPAFVGERNIYYKHADANFFSAYPFVVGKAISKIPQTLMDCFTFGTILYFMVGLTTTAENYFIFMAIISLFSILINELLFIFATIAPTKASVQVICACLVFFFILFSGFIIAPEIIPDFYIWVYWWNPMAWAYRALMVNEYRSAEYSTAQGDEILSIVGFVDSSGKPFTQEWVWYAFLYLGLHTVLCIILSALGLKYARPAPELNNSEEPSGDFIDDEVANQSVRIDFKPVALSFEDICYDVKASTGNEDLRLLTNVNGAFKAGRMCALMGTSGAGKTTLMDVIALRKTTGTISGEVRLNGHLQDPVSFRRCSGYVEQFDVQSPQLTVRETVLFSACLRLDPKKVSTEEQKQTFTDSVLRTLELTPLADCLVGSDEEGGLSFEQRKRLSIAVELAASPSILFLDEPTTGLDSRSALLVVKLLRKVADHGRTVCATIHQPSSAVFELFDDLLLLKKGGKTVYFGELGHQSKTMITYFERNGAKRIDHGDNPANWMLREVQDEGDRDLALIYLDSPEHAKLKRRLTGVKEDLNEALRISYNAPYAATAEERQKLVNKRLQTIYWRSPTYNRSRMLVCTIIAFILASVFITNRNLSRFSEAGMRAALSITFLSFIIIGILSITSVLPVMLTIRDIFYRHRAAGMLDNVSLGWALGTAEKWFIVLSSFFFCFVFIVVAGLMEGAPFRRSIYFWGIFTFNLAIYSYFGQAFMCCVPSMATAQILSSVFIGLNNFFSGLIVRPQFMTGFFSFTYWITPGHYVYEGLVLALFNDDDRPVTAEVNSEFYNYLECGDRVNDGGDPTLPCDGTVAQFVDSFFGGRFNDDHILQDVLVLALFLVVARVVTFFALKRFNFSSM